MPNEVRIWDGDEWVLVSGIAGQTGALGEHGSRWYTGDGSPDVVPLVDWSPSGVDVPPRPGDFYLNTVDSTYSEMT